MSGQSSYCIALAVFYRGMKMDELKKELAELVVCFKRRQVKVDNDEQKGIWQQATEELECILKKHDENYVERYECGCPVDEFGCQGFHGC
jgi:hypothetical protein